MRVKRTKVRVPDASEAFRGFSRAMKNVGKAAVRASKGFKKLEKAANKRKHLIHKGRKP